MLEGGDPNVVFGSCSPEAKAALQQTLSVVSGSPSTRDVTPHAKLGAVVLKVNAEVRLFSGGRSYFTLRLYLR